MQTEFLDASRLRLQRHHGALALVTPTRKTPLAPPRRALPLTKPDEYIVLNDCDGTELGWIRNIAELDEDSRTALQQSLTEIYLITQITHVREIDKDPISGQIRWRVEIARDEPSTESEGPLNLAAETATESDSTDADSGDSLSGTDTPLGKRARLLKKLSRDRDRDREEEETSGEERTFFISGTEDVQTARYPQIFIVDTERNRYQIVNCELLDVDSRRTAERYF